MRVCTGVEGCAFDHARDRLFVDDCLVAAAWSCRWERPSKSGRRALYLKTAHFLAIVCSTSPAPFRIAPCQSAQTLLGQRHNRSWAVQKLC